MRTLILTVCLAALPALSGCAGQCGSGSSLNGLTFKVFANPVSHQGQNLEAFTAGPTYYSYGVPSNGRHDWGFNWKGADVGPVDVIIDGQSFAGTGEWDPIECGNAIISFEGVYLDEVGVEHNFNATMAMTAFDNQIDGLLLWNEAWLAPDGQAGTFKSTSHFAGNQ